MNKAALALGLAMSSQLAFGVSTDLPGYNPTAVANTLIGSTGLINTNFGTAANSITDTSVATYILSEDTPAYVDLSFGTTSVFNGAGSDLSLFFVGDGGHSVGVTLFNGGTSSGTQTYSPSTYTGYNVSQGSTLYAIYYMDIDLADFSSFLGTNPVDVIRLDISGSSAVPSLLGSYDPNFAPIPIPAAVWMFGSGLIGLLGVARRRRA
jgi:hypothetical protein